MALTLEVDDYWKLEGNRGSLFVNLRKFKEVLLKASRDERRVNGSLKAFILLLVKV